MALHARDLIEFCHTLQTGLRPAHPMTPWKVKGLIPTGDSDFFQSIFLLYLIIICF